MSLDQLTRISEDTPKDVLLSRATEIGTYVKFMLGEDTFNPLHQHFDRELAVVVKSLSDLKENDIDDTDELRGEILDLVDRLYECLKMD